MPVKIGNYFYFDFYKDVYKDNPDCTYYFLLSGRSTGKTYSTTRFIMDKKNCPAPVGKDNLFCLVSRDLGKSRRRIDYFKAFGIECDRDKYINRKGEIVGFNMAVTLSENYKSMGTEMDELFKKVRWIIFDEFTAISSWDYVDHETENFLSIISTVTRNRDDIQIILNGNILNSQSVYNPYFEAFDIDWDKLEIEIGDTKIIDYKLGKNTAKWAVHYGHMAFASDMLHVGKANLVPHNAPALTGLLEPSPYEWKEAELPIDSKLIAVYWMGRDRYFGIFAVPAARWEQGNTLIVIYLDGITDQLNPLKAKYTKYNDICYDISVLDNFLRFLFTDEFLQLHYVRFFKGRTESEVWKLEKKYELENNGRAIWIPEGRRF